VSEMVKGSDVIASSSVHLLHIPTYKE